MDASFIRVSKADCTFSYLPELEHTESIFSSIARRNFVKMSGDDSYSVATRYRTVRKHLDSLGYKQALSFDALPLIEKLLADLIQTTESLKHFKTIAQENIEACSQLQSTVDPYKCDNARLVHECNQLYTDLIVSKEAYQRQIKDLKKQIYRLECECNDIQLASSRNLHRIKELETESSKKSKKILELQGKCLKPTISNVALAAKQRPCYPLRRPVLESEPMTKAGSSSSLPVLSTPEPKVLDLLTMADHRMSSLSHEISKLKGELSNQTDNVHILKSQLTSKEKEVLRLKKMLEGGRPYLAVSKDCACKRDDNFESYEYVGSNEFHSLQQEKLELEERLKDTVAKQHDAMTQALKLAERNEELEKELRDIDHIALAVEADCNTAVKENNRRVSKLQEKLEDAMTQIRVLESEKTVERKEVQELRADLEACRLEKRNIQRTLESTVEEKKKMIDRVNELTVIEKSLNNEIERLSRENESQRHDIIELQCNNRILKEQVSVRGTFQTGSTKDLSSFKDKGDKNDQNKASKNHRDVHSGYGTESYDIESKERDCLILTLQETITQVRKERDYYRSEYNNIKELCDRTPDDDSTELWTRIRELKRQLIEKENALDDAQREKRELMREKSSLENRSQLCRCEHRQSCHTCGICKRTVCTCSASLGGSSSGTKAMIDRLEHERDMARADVERLIQERDILRERLQMAAETHTSEQRRMRDNLLDLESRLKHIDKEKQDLVLTQGTRRATINGLEDQLDDMREELRRTKQELASQRTQYIQLRALQDQTDQALGDVQSQLTQSEAELNKATDRNRAMERQQIQLDTQVKELKHEINTLRSKMSLIDHEKDQLLMVLDEKTERIASLEREIISKEQQVIGMQQQIRELQQKHDICIDQSAEQERQVRSMQMEIENLQRQLEGTSADGQNAVQENRRLQEDLAAVTCEVRNLQRELEVARGESYELKRQLQTYVSEVRRAEEMLNRKESERTEMLNHFRSLTFEASVLENNNHSLESEAAEARGALQNARDQLLDLEQQLANKDSLTRGYETQISNLTQTIANMETQLRQESDQRSRTEADLKAVRDLCMQLDRQKEDLMEQLGDKNCLKTQYDSQMARLKAEHNIIQSQMERDRATMERLEALLDQARQESMNAHASNQELQNEVSRLKNKISELQSKLSAESEELRQYQKQAAEYSKQISELRRQVTNERFDRARKEEESRRNKKETANKSVQKDVPKDSKGVEAQESHPSAQETVSHRYFQKEDPAEYEVAEEARKTPEEQLQSSCRAKGLTCCRTKDGQLIKTKPCLCSFKVRKNDHPKGSYSEPSTIHKPLLESTRIDETDKISMKGNTDSRGPFVTMNLSSIMRPKREALNAETLKVSFGESPNDLKGNMSTVSKSSQSDDDPGMHTTRRADSIYPQNTRLTHPKFTKDESNKRTKMCSRTRCLEHAFQAYQQRQYALKKCKLNESSRCRINRPTHDPSDKHSLRKREYNVTKSHGPEDAENPGCSVLLRYLPSFNRESKRKDASPSRDEANKHSEKRVDFPQEDVAMEKSNYAENIKEAQDANCATCCGGNDKDPSTKCPISSGGACSSCQGEENLTKVKLADTRHQDTMTELRDEMLAKLDFAQSNLMKTLGEIKEQTNHLEEQLAIINKHMNNETYSQGSVQDRSMIFATHSTNAGVNQENKPTTKRNENTQQPDKKNTCVQNDEFTVCVNE